MMLKILSKTPFGEHEKEIEFYKCQVVNETDNEESFEIILHKQQVDLYEMLTHLQKSLNLYPQTMKEIWGKIELYGNYRRNEKVWSAIRDGLINDNKQV